MFEKSKIKSILTEFKTERELIRKNPYSNIQSDWEDLNKLITRTIAKLEDI